MSIGMYTLVFLKIKRDKGMDRQSHSHIPPFNFHFKNFVVEYKQKYNKGFFKKNKIGENIIPSLFLESDCCIKILFKLGSSQMGYIKKRYFFMYQKRWKKHGSCQKVPIHRAKVFPSYKISLFLLEIYGRQ